MKSLIITDNLIQIIKLERTKKNLSGAVLSEQIGKKSNNFISLIESHRIGKIKIEDLRKLLKILFGLEGEALDEYIENILNDKSEKTEDSPTEESNELNIYSNDEELIAEEDFSRIKNFLLEILTMSFKRNPKYTYNSLRLLIANLHFDVGFVFSLFKLPFFLLKDADTATKQRLLNEINTVVKKYLDEYAPKKDSSEEI